MAEYGLLSKLYYKNKAEYEKKIDIIKNSDTTIFLPIKVNGNQSFIVPTFENMKLSQDIYNLNTILKQIQQELPPVATTIQLKDWLISEVMLTNDIEGVYSTRKDITDILEKNEKDTNKLRFEGMVKKYNLLIGDENIEFELNHSGDIRNLYDEIVSNEIEEKDKPDGKIFRKGSVDVISSAQKIKHQGLYPENDIIYAMDNALNVLKDDAIPMLCRISIFHFLFGYIHPFYDGNGRVSRFISSYLLRNELDRLVSLRLSYTIKNNKNYYYKAFDICNDKKNVGDLTFFVTSFLTIIKNTLDDIVDSLIDKHEEMSYYNYIIENLKIKKNKSIKKEILQVFVSKALFSSEEIGFSREEIFAGIGYKSMQSIIKILNEMIETLPIEVDKSHRKYLYSINLDNFDEMDLNKVY